MNFALIGVIGIGVVGGAGIDELLRGRDPRSKRVMVAGLIGAVAGLVVHRAMGEDGVLLDMLEALLGAALVAFAVRVRLSAAIARARS